MAHLLLAKEQKGEVKLGFRFAILFAGFLSLSSVHDCYTSLTFDIPTLHIYGTGDQIVLSTTSEKLKSVFSDSVAIVHEGGHFIPSMSKYKDVFNGFLESEDAQIGHKDFLKNVKSDPEKQVTSFRVYLHRRNKFIHAWLRISADEVTLERSKTDVVVWPLQFLRRYGYTSAGAGVGSEYLAQPSGYNSYHRGSTQRLRNIVIPPPPRPRSVGEGETPGLPPDSFHPHRHNTFVDQRIVGNIVSENTNPSAIDEASRRRSSAASQKSAHGVFSVPYVNISPQEVYNDGEFG
ncbi:unnamed protein product [Heligmosomoides polygyrus]|uniref:FSH1 domain-containing protein n=1 Tax=Heligmosomoides polygyrus TaxID=6339 RepID=A0A183FF37_HELPZ|nr:unnamed protein product [Heligmosomoides polygyrus]